jgi:diguanylate cyclase (GGDEF)-like protein/PAS domain S-box-containing protein
MLNKKSSLVAIAAFGLGLFSVLILPFLYSVQLRSVEDRLFNQVEPLMESTQQLQTSMLTMEAGADGYRSTGDARFLGTYDAGLQNFDTAVHLAEPQARAVGGILPASLARTVTAGRTWQRAAAAQRAQARAEGSPAPSAESAALFDTFRVRGSALQVSLLQTETSTQAEMRAAERSRAVAFDAAGGVLVLLVAAFAFLLLQRQRSLQREAQAARSLHESDEKLRALVAASPIATFALDLEGNVQMYNPAAEQVFGRDETAVAGRRAPVWAEESTAIRLTSRVRGGEAVEGVETSWWTREGVVRDVSVSAAPLHDVNGQVEGLMVAAVDITERKQFEQQLQRQAFHDALTELPNRALYLDRLQHALAVRSRSPHSIAVLFLDLDGFKVVNDSLGHAAGDLLLMEIAGRLRSTVRPEDTVARFGGDEFAVLLENVHDPDDAALIAERAIRIVRQPCLLDGQEVVVTVSVGIAFSPEDERDREPGDLLRDADIALYRAKAAGKARAVAFEASMSQQANDRLSLQGDLRRAIERGELRLVYQPIVDLKTGALRGTEALLRWHHATRGLIPPTAFIPLAEESGLIHPIGRWLLTKACRQARTWQDRFGHDDGFTMSVNVSVRELAQPGLCAQVRQALRDTGLDARALQLEITESTLMEEAGPAMAAIDDLKALGVRLALDDFGTGYSSLSYLRRFPVDTLKLDQSFIVAVDHDEGATAIVEAVATLAHAQGMVVTAEGIETVEHLHRVRALHCDYGQGYYFSRPLAPDELEKSELWSEVSLV